MTEPFAPPVDYYVYYRIDATSGDSAPAALRQIRAMQEALAARTGIVGQLMRRRDDHTTLMEIYPGVGDPPTFEQALDAAVEASGIAALIEPGSARHIERFIPCV